MKKLTVIITSLLLLLCCIPCNIFAEPVYNVVPISDEYVMLDSVTNAKWRTKNDAEIRAIIIKKSSTYRMYFVSTATGVKAQIWNGNGGNDINLDDLTYLDNNITYNIGYNTASNVTAFTNNVKDILGYVEADFTAYDAWYYTFGQGGGGEPIQWGMLLDIGFSTSLATNGDRQLGYNIDYISWNNQIDSHGNAFIDTCKVEVNARAVFYWNTYYNGLFDENAIDRVEGETSVLIDKPLATATMPRQKTWQAVANALNMSISELSPHLQDDNWYQNGWIYEIRLIEETSGYVGPWQRLNTITSLPPNQTQNVYNSTTINQSVINAIQIVNNQNIEENTTNNETNYHTENWTINETVINSGNQPEYPGIPELINYEDDFGADLTNDLQDLDLDTPFTFLNGTGMQKALHWIRQVHLETIEQTELLTPLLVTMLVGLAVYLIGRRRG